MSTVFAIFDGRYPAFFSERRTESRRVGITASFRYFRNGKLASEQKLFRLTNACLGQIFANRHPRKLAENMFKI